MTNFDVFNGDADGICARQQWRLAYPGDAVAVTGVKRDISLVKNVMASPGDKVTVFDISLDKNRDAVMELAQKGISITYFDHHFPGEIPKSNNLNTIIDTSSEVCTSLLVNKYLDNRFSLWAVVGAFGDNLHKSATQLACQCELTNKQTTQLKELGELMNYNGYGASLDDLHITPEQLSDKISPFKSPFDFIESSPEIYASLKEGYSNDMRQAASLSIYEGNDNYAVYLLPNQSWARRVSGVFANQLATSYPNRAHAMLTCKDDGNYLVSVRAPLSRKEDADKLCLEFPTGGGRKGAAGINSLPLAQIDHFIERFRFTYPGF